MIKKVMDLVIPAKNKCVKPQVYLFMRSNLNVSSQKYPCCLQYAGYAIPKYVTARRLFLSTKEHWWVFLFIDDAVRVDLLIWEPGTRNNFGTWLLCTPNDGVNNLLGWTFSKILYSSLLFSALCMDRRHQPSSQVWTRRNHHRWEYVAFCPKKRDFCKYLFMCN